MGGGPVVSRSRGATAMIRFAPVLVAALLLATARGAAVGQEGGSRDVAQALAGAIDIHVHNLPDDRPRSIDAIDVATLASRRGMRAIVLKSHYESTAGIAYLVRQTRARHRSVWWNRPQPDGGRYQPGGCGAHDEGHRRMGPYRVDAHVRRRTPGALFQRKSTICQRLARRRTPTGRERRHRR